MPDRPDPTIELDVEDMDADEKTSPGQSPPGVEDLEPQVLDDSDIQMVEEISDEAPAEQSASRPGPPPADGTPLPPPVSKSKSSARSKSSADLLAQAASNALKGPSAFDAAPKGGTIPMGLQQIAAARATRQPKPATPSPAQPASPTTEARPAPVRGRARPPQRKPSTASAAENASTGIRMEVELKDTTVKTNDKVRAMVMSIIAGLELELAAIDDDDPESAAQLHYEIGRLYEDRLGDLQSAKEHFVKSRVLSPDTLPTLSALRRIAAMEQDSAQVLSLFDIEARLTADASRRSALLVHKALYQEDLKAEDDAEETLNAALSHDPNNVLALETLVRQLRKRKQHDRLYKTLERLATVVRDERQRAAIFTDMGLLAEAQRKDDDDARASYRHALEANPANGRTLKALIRLEAAHGNHADLSALLEREAELTRDPVLQHAARYAVGHIQLALLGGESEAARALEHAAQILPTDELALQSLAEAHRRTARWHELADVLQRILAVQKERGERVQTLCQLGETQNTQLGLQDEAIRTYRAALQLDPTCIPALQGLGGLYHGTNRHADRIELDLQEADRITLPSQRADRLCQAAELCEAFLGDSDRALEIFRRARHVAPDHYAAFVALDRLLSARQEWPELAQLYRQEAGHTSDGRRKVALLLKTAQLEEEKLGDLDEAMVTLRKVIQMAPENLMALQGLVRLKEHTGEFREVIDLYERQAVLLQDDREICALMRGIGRIYEDRLDDPERAVTAYERVLDRFPQDTGTHLRLGRLLEKLGRWQELAVLYERQIALEPDPLRVAALRLRIGRLQETQLAMADEAAVSYHKALDANPDYDIALGALSDMHRRRNEPRELAKVLEEVAARSRTPHRTANTWLRIGEIRQDSLNDQEGALEAYHEALRHVPGYDPAARALLLLHGVRASWSHLAASLGEEAARVTYPERRINAMLQLADLYAARLSDPQRAAACLEEVLSMDPDNPDALRALLPTYRRLKRWKDFCAATTRIAHTSSDPAVAAAMLHERARVAERYEAEDPAIVLEQILQITPGDPMALAALERIYRRRGESGQLARILELRCQQESDPATRRSLLTSVADALADAGAVAPAKVYYQNTLTEFPTHLPAMRSLRALMEATGDYAAIADLLEREADVLADRAAAVNALVRAGELRVRFRDTGRARSDFERVLELDPTHDAAFSGLTDILAGASDFNALAQAYRRRIDALEDDPRANGLRLELAETLDRRLQNQTQAIGVLKELLQGDPNHRGALEMLASIYEADQRWPETVQTYDRIAELAREDGISPDPEWHHYALLRTGQIRFEHLADPAGAIRALYTALRLVPEEPQTLNMVVAVHRHDGDWQRAADALERLLNVSKPEDRVKRLLELADIRDNWLNDPEGAQELLVQAIENAPRDAMALDRLKRHFDRSGQWDIYSNMLETALRRIGKNSRSTVPLRIALADVYAERQERVGDAARQLQQAVEADPADPLPRLARARLHLRPPPRLDHAALELREVLKVSPWSHDAYRLLQEVFRHLDDLDKQACADAIANYLDPARKGERPADPMEGRPPFDRMLGEGAYTRLCAPREEPVAARAVLAIIEPAVAKVFPPDLGRYGVDRSGRISAGSDHPVRLFAEDVGQMLGIEGFSLYLANARPIDVGVEPEDPPALIVGARVPATATPQELRFLIGRALSRILGRNLSLARLGPRELMATLGGLCDQFDLNPAPFLPKGVSLDEGRQLGRAIMRNLPRKTRKSLEEPVRRMYDAPTPDPQQWQMLAALGSCRAGLVVSGDIRVALEAMRRFDVARGRGEPGPAKVDNAPALLIGNTYCEDLLRYAVSDDYFEARRKLGIRARPST